eukprot:2771-Heterococcus_DN1.PRE.2
MPACTKSCSEVALLANDCSLRVVLSDVHLTERWQPLESLFHAVEPDSRGVPGDRGSSVALKAQGVGAAQVVCVSP